MKFLSEVRYISLVIIIVAVFYSGMTELVFAKPIQGVGRKDVIDRFNQDPDAVIDVSSIEGNPISKGSDLLVGKSNIAEGKVEGIFTTETDNYGTLLNTTMARISNVVNFALGFLALFALIYLIVQGVKMLLNPDDDNIQTQALDAIKTVVWVLIGIGLTWLIITAVFFVISLFAR